MTTKKVFIISFLASLLFACKKDENKIFLESSTAPVLTATNAGPIVLNENAKSATIITFNWTNPNYVFTTGVSSQNVIYTLQVDTTGKNFKSTKLQESSLSSDLGHTYIASEFNSFFSKMELKAGVQHSVDIRIKASLVNGAAPLYSNVITLKVTPYLDYVVEPPGTKALLYADGALWTVGDAFASGWNNPLPSPYDVSQKFTRIDILHYELVVPINGTGGYKLIQKQGDWSTQYHALDGSTGAALSGSFEKKDADPQFPTPGVAGTYKIEVNFQTGKYKLTKQ